jgi:hypothetical protein
MPTERVMNTASGSASRFLAPYPVLEQGPVFLIVHFGRVLPERVAQTWRLSRYPPKFLWGNLHHLC